MKDLAGRNILQFIDLVEVLDVDHEERQVYLTLSQQDISVRLGDIWVNLVHFGCAVVCVSSVILLFNE